MLKSPFAAVLAVVLLSGCASVATRPKEATASRTYPASEDAIWQRILSTSARKSLVIRQADAAGGIVTADREIVVPLGAFDGAILDWAYCPRGGVLDRTVGQRVEIEYLVRRHDGATTVTLHSRFAARRMRLPSRRTQWVNCTSTGTFEESVFHSLYYDSPN